jgi:hypothetical protein
MALAEILPPTTRRVERNTSAAVNEQIEHDTIDRLRRTAEAGPAAIAARLRELDEEWDMERRLETNASLAVLTGLTLGFLVNRRFFALPDIVAAFLLQHATQGWCPPVPILRRFFKVRTAREIETERTALRILLGDFETPTRDPAQAFARAECAAYGRPSARA